MLQKYLIIYLSVIIHWLIVLSPAIKRMQQ